MSVTDVLAPNFVKDGNGFGPGEMIFLNNCYVLPCSLRKILGARGIKN